ncbi:E3 ubiquitin-protein ligase RNF13 isoform X2 [Planococcus citri]|uniref:E3 ubiquitin-protein ligase RNF13 isoform X2 n=1 Tax=Planococcus citri TaxID=170843 RepID=UPI0031FA3B96
MLFIFQHSCQDVWIFMTSAFVSIFSMQCYADISVYDARTNQQIDGGYMAIASKFGPPFPPEGFEGMIVKASPEDGCQGIIPPPTRSINYTGKWIALIRRGTCTFDEKVRNAQNASYDLAIVYNNSSEISMYTEPMHASNGSDIRIYSVFVGLHTGLKLERSYLYVNEVYVVIEDDSNFPFDINADLIIPFAVVVAVCFITMISFMICKCIRDRRRARRHRLPTSSLRKLPIEKFSKGSPYETCAICLDDYIDGEKLRILPCQHAYHAKCIDPWLTRNRRVCPICKRKVFAADELPHEGSDSDSDSDNDERTPLVRSEPQQRPFRRPLLLPWQPRVHNPSSSASSRSSVGESEGTSRHLMPARAIRSVNSADDDSILDLSTSGSLYSYNSTGHGSVNALQLPQSIVFSDGISQSVSIESEVVRESDNNSEIARNV